jgi:hypothetical protein
MHRTIVLALVAGGLFAAVAAPARAEGMEPVIVVPGRPGVPVMFWGRDISYAVVEGDWGLARPGQVAPTVVQEGWASPIYGAPAPYFPRTGHRPRSGRLEVIPPANRRLPRPAQTYYRDWMSLPDTSPVTILPPYDPPPVIVAPRIGNRFRSGPATPAPPGGATPVPIRPPIPYNP